ncbi:MAG: ribokinase [Actinobacteria bacterium]|nr:MAG: ribokinase [Actinomycetota bacterium]TML64895.1 MAG: ribokinase [Actinomycetota bacterium]
MLVCTLGDLLLDVVVALDRDLVSGDDVPARTSIGAGGQAANVAAWTAELGARARFIGVRADDDGGRLAAAALHARGVELVGPVTHAGGGVVVSIVGPGGERTMASDRGGGARLCGDELDPAWLECDHLHVSGYALAAEPMRTAAGRAVELAREYGARVSVDVAAATLVEAIGVETFRALLAALAPDVVFCNDDEDRVAGGPVPGSVWVVKHGAGGASVDGARLASKAAVRVVDTTGAGDAFAAGWIVGGITLALEAAARCVAQLGAMPPTR